MDNLNHNRQLTVLLLLLLLICFKIYFSCILKLTMTEVMDNLNHNRQLRLWTTSIDGFALTTSVNLFQNILFVYFETNHD